MVTTCMTINRGMYKEIWSIYTMEYYSTILKNEIMSFAAIWDGPRDYHIKWSKLERERQTWYVTT